MIGATQFALEKDRIHYLRRFGSYPLSYASLQQGLNYFCHPDIDGYIAYKKIYGYDFVLGSPIFSKKDYSKALKLFIQSHPKSIFCQVDASLASILDEMGLFIHGFGESQVIDLKDFKISWRVRPDLKRWLSSLSKLNLKVEEIDINHIYLNILNRKWMEGRKKELSFMARPFSGGYSKDVLAFILYQADEPLGFVSFDPIYEEGKIISYELQHWRALPQAPNGAMDFLLTNALFLMREKDISLVSLGISPLYNRDQASFVGMGWVDYLLNMMSKTSMFYNFQGLGRHKSSYKGIKKHLYLAFPKMCSIRGLLGLLKVNGLI